jgi:predicted esterase
MPVSCYFLPKLCPPTPAQQVVRLAQGLGGQHLELLHLRGWHRAQAQLGRRGRHGTRGDYNLRALYDGYDRGKIGKFAEHSHIAPDPNSLHHPGIQLTHRTAC